MLSLIIAEAEGRKDSNIVSKKCRNYLTWLSIRPLYRGSVFSMGSGTFISFPLEK
jgi:hypothetical protein